MTTSYDYTYANCLERSRRANWDLADFDDLHLDFSRPFLPEELAQTSGLSMLTVDERLRLNQIRGYSYAYLFRYVEEYIVGLVDQLSDDHDDSVVQETLDQFLTEEAKHQALFAMFEQRFLDGFGSDCGVVGNLEQAAEEVLGHSKLAVLLLTAMLEWLTQAHYLAYFNERSAVTQLDESYCELFRLHWVEEAQHARIDTLETVRVMASLEEGERRAAIEEFLVLCTKLSSILHAQADLDVRSLAATRADRWPDDEWADLIAAQRAATFHTFVGLGIRNRHFRRLVGEVHPDGVPMVDGYLAAHR